jgi:hypothetical protein
MARRNDGEATRDEWRWRVRVIAMPLMVSLIAGGSAVWAARDDGTPARCSVAADLA